MKEICSKGNNWNSYQIAKLDLITLSNVHVCLGAALFADDTLTSLYFFVQLASSSNVISMTVGVD